MTASPPTLSPRTKKQPHPQQLRGTVVGAKKMGKTITVSVERFVWHPKIHKQYRRSKTCLVHDAREEANVGDEVVIEQTRPLSRRKNFRLVEIRKRAARVDLPEETGEQAPGLASPELPRTEEGNG